VLRQSRASAGDALILLGVVAAACWAVTTVRMQGMSLMSRADLGAIGWFVGVWTTMMAAMMLPSLAPAVIARGRMTRSAGSLAGTLLFAAGYLVVWTAAGVIAYVVIEGSRPVAPAWLATGGHGNYLAGAVLIGAAAYELTPLKRGFLRLCRAGAPAIGRRRLEPIAPLVDGLEHGGYCVGCCWGLMAALFALEVMSLAWMVLIAAVIAAEKLLPWDRAARWGAAGLLAALCIVVIV